MIAQFDHKAVSSLLLYLDHYVLKKGQAYKNFGSRFYPGPQIYNGLYTYYLPFKQIIADSSIAGAQVMSGIYLNNSFIMPGQSGLVDINFEQGQVYFSSDVSTSLLSGNFAVKDFNVKLTSLPDETLLFETKYSSRPKTSRQITGLAPETETYPVLFLRNEGGENVPFAMGGQDQTQILIRGAVFSDSQYNLDGLFSILRDRVRTFIPMLEVDEMPFNSYGGLKSGVYHYDNLTAPKNSTAQTLFIEKVVAKNFAPQSRTVTELMDMNPTIYPGLISIQITAERYPRL